MERGNFMKIKHGLILLTLLLNGCATSVPNLAPANRVKIKYQKVYLPQPTVNATFGLQNNANVVQAYKNFVQKGQKNNIYNNGFVTVAYDAYKSPILACAPLHLCVIQLEQNEKINNIELGDAQNWLVHTALLGTSQQGSYSISLKPKEYNLATNMLISTNKRIYNIRLVSKQGFATKVMSFYYPVETLTAQLKKSQHNFNKNKIIAQTTNLALNKLNFNYELSGNKTSWQPIRVFDDGKHTFIQMPASVAQSVLPVLYLAQNDKLQLTNYRYQQPYYIVDGLFNTAYLITGSGKNQQRVIIQQS